MIFSFFSELSSNALKCALFSLLLIYPLASLLAEPSPLTPLSESSLAQPSPAASESLVIESLDGANLEFWPLFFKMLLLLGGLIVLLLLAASFIKRMMSGKLHHGNLGAHIQLIERKSLHPKAALYLLRVDNQMFLAAESEGGIQSLGQWCATKEQESSQNNL